MKNDKDAVAAITLEFVAPDGSRRSIAGRAGGSLMRAAVDAGVAEIAADCGGLLSCATCHVIVDAAWAGRLPPADAEEESMLEMTAAPRQRGSRLACQIVLDAACDGLVVHLPPNQY